jgi:GH18 family chitinase
LSYTVVFADIGLSFYGRCAFFFIFIVLNTHTGGAKTPYAFFLFYHRSFKYATGLNQPHGGNDVASWPDDEGSPQYFNIYAKLPNMLQVRDNKSKTQYAYTSRLEQPGLQLPEGVVSFDDERAICDKVNYVQQHDLGGFIIWELCKFIVIKCWEVLNHEAWSQSTHVSSLTL